VARKAEYKWLAQTLRLTCFPVPGSDHDALAWQDITGDPPDVDERRPKELIRRQVGAYLDGHLELLSAPFRVDITYSPRPPTSVPNLSAITIGPFQTVLAPHFDNMRRWLSSCDLPINRMAVGAVLHLPAKSTDDSYRYLKALIRSVNVKPGKMRDLIYRVNWPVADEELNYINRITIWSSMKATLTAAGPSPDQELVSEDFVQLELDVSTPAISSINAPSFQKDKLSAIYEKLTNLARENAREGEIESSE
jgi:hypothetical protein